MLWEILMLVALILVNGVFAMAEMSVVSARKIRLQQRAEQGDERAKEALALANSPNEFLSTVQVGITVIGVFAGAFSGVTLAAPFGDWLDSFAWISPYGHTAGFVVVVSIITYLSLVVGELVPKRFALSNPEGAASLIARPMRRLSRMAGPAVAFLSWSTDRCARALGLHGHSEPPVSEDEVKGLIDQGLGAGVFHQAERDMVEGVFRLDQLKVGELMTPSTRIVWLDLDQPPEENWRRIVTSGHSQFPVYQGNRDNLVGAVSVKALWANLSLTGVVDLRSVVVPPIVVPESMLVLKLVDAFRQRGTHFALVTDEFGSIQGLVTLHDVLETILGQVPEKGQRSQPSARRREDGSWLIDAAMEIADAKRVLRIRRIPGEGRGEFVSLGGFIIDQLERIPQEGDRVVAAGYVFEVVDMDRQRIDKVLATRVSGKG
ncbi:magnesium and cobalt efflux protein CorC [mine drainage metagenome]|uniref:Magnesium and cobalt efflux protein CorC n=1 Tax=mine drainage metagenome TaxID=410659 RepID=A0A1J5SMG7_9ZZZZ